MYLRKYIMGGIIDDITQIPYERVVKFEIRARNEMMDTVNYTLVCEVMPRYSNIILVNQNGVVGDAIRHVPLDLSAKRQILPSLKYEPPASQNKLTPFSPELSRKIAGFAGGSLSNYIFGLLQGVAKITVEEALLRAKIPDRTKKIDDKTVDLIAAELQKLTSPFVLSPCVRLSSDKEIADFCPYPFTCDTGDYVSYPSLNDAADSYYSQRDSAEILKRKANFISQALRSAITKIEKKLSIFTEKAVECANCGKYKLYGELITANIYRVPPKSAAVTVNNYYSGEDITVALDPSLTPSKNAAAYYKKYNKQKKSLEYLHPQIENLKIELEYLYSVKASLQLAENMSDLAEIEKELLQENIIKQPKSIGKTTKQPKIAAAEPLKIEYAGYTILIGKNNLLNDRLTFKLAKPDDVWLHVRNAHGAHVIIVTDSRKIPGEVIARAAALTAFYSELSQSPKVTVDYTEKKNVKKLGKPGLARYTVCSSIIVCPENIE